MQMLGGQSCGAARARHSCIKKFAIRQHGEGFEPQSQATLRLFIKDTMKRLVVQAARLGRQDPAYTTVLLPAFSRPVVFERFRPSTPILRYDPSHSRHFTCTATAQFVERQPIESRYEEALISRIRHLPLTCPGFGGTTQFSKSGSAGYYSIDRSVVQRYLNHKAVSHEPKKEEDAVYNEAIANIDAGLQKQLGLDPTTSGPFTAQEERHPRMLTCFRTGRRFIGRASNANMRQMPQHSAPSYWCADRPSHYQLARGHYDGVLSPETSYISCFGRCRLSHVISFGDSKEAFAGSHAITESAVQEPSICQR